METTFKSDLQYFISIIFCFDSKLFDKIKYVKIKEHDD